MKEGQPVPRRERRRQTKLQKETNKKPKITRRLFIGGAALAGLSLLALFANANRGALFGTTKEEEEFSGEVEQTKGYLKKWENEVKGFPELPEEYFPKIADLATAFFSRQMGYDREQLKDAIIFLHDQEFKTIPEIWCASTPPTGGIAFTPVMEEGKAYVSRERVRESSNPMVNTFAAGLHELHHVRAPLKDYFPPISAIGVGEGVYYERGLMAIKRRQDKKECVDVYRNNIEEAVVQDSADRLLGLLGLSIDYEFQGLIVNYRKNVLDRFYNGDYLELLFHQQRTDPFSFFRSIGEKIGAKNPFDQANAGYTYLRDVLAVP